MRVSLLIALLALTLASARLFLERAADGPARELLASTGLDRFADFERLEVDLPDHFGARRLTLIDPVSGAVVARVSRLDVELSGGLSDESPLGVARILGRGGRVEILTGAERVSEVPLIRALIGLVGTIIDAIPAAGAGASVAMPPILFRDVEVVVHAPGRPLLRYGGIGVEITESYPGGPVTAAIAIGDGKGSLDLVFDGDLLTRIVADDLFVGPSIELMLGRSWGQGIADALAPVGRVDLEVLDPASDMPSVNGVLRNARLSPPALPFPVEIDELPFHMQQGSLVIHDAPLRFHDGRATLDASGDLEHLDLHVAVHDSAFRASYLALLPATQKLPWLHCDDGGSFDLALRMRLSGATETGGMVFESGASKAPRISGGGGFHVMHLAIDPPGLDLNDLMGRFTVEQDSLLLDEVSASVGGGRLRLSGSLGLSDDSFVLEIEAEDLDVEAIHQSIHPGNSCGNDLAGWLQGSMRVEGDFKAPRDVNVTGQLSVRSGKFMETNLLTSIFSGAALGGVQARDDQRLSMVFSTQDRRLFLDPVAVDLGSLGLTGTGWVDQQGRLGLQLVLFRQAEGWLGEVFGFLQRNLLLQVEVGGSLNQPEVATYPLAVLTRNLAQALDFFTSALTGDSPP